MILPYDWFAPRKEFFLQGFDDKPYCFQFEAIEIPLTHIANEPQFSTMKAKCSRCGVLGSPSMKSMRKHARLHMIVDLVREGR